VFLIKRTGQPVERRISKDLWAHIFILINFFAWGVLFVSLLVFHKAQPEFETFFDKFYRLDLRTSWDMNFVQYLVYTIILGLVVSVMGLSLSRFRARRKTDHKKNLLILGFLYLFLFFLFWIFFT